jgi:Cu2+-exporting ATPase
MDISISFPSEGCIRLHSRFLFANPAGLHCRRFVARVLDVDGVSSVSIQGQGALFGSNMVEIRYCPNAYSRQQAIAAISARLVADDRPASHPAGGPGAGAGNGNSQGDSEGAYPTNGNGHADGKGYAKVNGHAQGTGVTRPSSRHGAVGPRPSGRTGGGPRGSKRARGFAAPMPRLWKELWGAVAHRPPNPGSHGSAVRAIAGSGWVVQHESRGRIRLQNERLHRRRELCQAIERELMSVLGIDNYRTSTLTGSVLILYDPQQLREEQVIEILDSALSQAEEPAGKDKADLHLPLCTLSLPLAATSQFLVPPLIPISAGLFLYTSIPTFRNAREVLFGERRLGVDVLDAIVVVGCLGTLQIFAGSVLCWCLGFGRVLVKKTQDDSKRLLLNAFGKQPRYVWLYKDGVEVQILLDRLQKGDIIVVNTGEVVPVDGCITEGLAMIDQHALTGESTPAEKGVGDRVFACTVMVAGKIYVEVEKAGNETASAKISQILEDTAGYKLTSQHKGERLADKAVIPTLALASLGMATMGPGGAVAILNSDFGTGIRMAAPLAMLSSLALCAHKGILVKDGRALELMNEIDTVLFDKTGTLTRERPEVGRIIACGPYRREEILRYAAAAEAKFAHPIAKAILHAFEAIGQALPPIDDSRYHVGYGISVQIEGRTIRVGSARFMELEAIEIPAVVRTALDEAHREGNTLVMVAVDGALGGAIELQAAVRPEVRSIIEGLRARGIQHIAIISGDHEAPTRKLAESLGMDRYFAQVLPADKADYVERLQNEGRKVCFVGDGINDSIALKKANVSISLRGATSIATDTAHIVFMEEGLAKLCDLRDIARDLDRNVRRSWQLILAPNGLCIAGAFTMGFGVMTSVLTNNVAALAALANGLLPLRRIAHAQAASQLEQEKRLAQAAVIQDQPATVLAIEPVGPAGPAGTLVATEALPAGPTGSPVEPARRECSGNNGVRLGECLFERPLKRSLDDELRGLILDAVAGRREQLPFPAEFEWHPVEPVLMVKSKLLPIHIAFDAGRLTVHAKLSLAARMLATDGNRKRTIRLIEEIADELDL